MINLLFISSSPRAELLRVHFQQLLKIRIDLVADFDHGLKDVFEKRPLVVCIQDRIGDISGESVARHIQLLLGTGAPSFVLLHESAAKTKGVPGLFNHLVDLNAPFETVCEALQNALHLLLGEHWDKIYSPPVAVPSQPAAEELPSFESAAQHEDAFITEHSIFNPAHAAPLPGFEPNDFFSSENPFEQDAPGGPPAEPEVVPDNEAVAGFELLPVASEPFELVTAAPETPQITAVIPAEPVPAVQEPIVSEPPEVNALPSVSVPLEAGVIPERPVRPVRQTPPPKPPPVQEMSFEPAQESVAVDELLQAYEQTYRRRKLLTRLIAFGVLLVVLGGLALLVFKKRGSIMKTGVPEKQQTVAQPARPAVQPTTSSAVVSQPVAPPVKPVPSFVARAEHDAAFSEKNPGWSRYTTRQREYRLFHADNRLQALQVLTSGDEVIASGELKQALQELAGSEQYRVKRREYKGKLVLERATVANKAELLIYRSKSQRQIKAFVFAYTP